MRLNNPFRHRLIQWFFLGALLAFVGWRAWQAPAPIGSASRDSLLRSLLAPSSSPSPTPSPTPFGLYRVPNIPNHDSYAVFLAGDSMTAALGPHPSQLALRLNQRYPQKGFIVDNYSEGSQNILRLLAMLSRPINLDGRMEPAALERKFDILVIESMGHNPLSEYQLEEGLRLQTAALDQAMLKVIDTHPNSVVIFLATIAPSEKDYAKGVLDLPTGLRANYATERRAYIENFIAYAKQHQIPLVDVYSQSLNPDGSLKTVYVNRDDYIHPSQVGVDFIQDELADYIIDTHLLPY